MAHASGQCPHEEELEAGAAPELGAAQARLAVGRAGPGAARAEGRAEPAAWVSKGSRAVDWQPAARLHCELASCLLRSTFVWVASLKELL